MNDAIIIRELRPDDSVPAITALLHAAYAPLAAAGFRYVATHQDDATTRSRLAHGRTFIAELDGCIVGTVTVRAARPGETCPWYQRHGVFTFGQFAVRPDLQRGGIGNRLIAACERTAIEQGAEHLALDTAEGATHLVEWYARLGFRLVGHVSWPDTNYRSVVMSKPLRE